MRPQDENRERLVQFLRDDDAQREADFIWHYGYIHNPMDCGVKGCALGAAKELGIIDFDSLEEEPEIVERLCHAIALPASSAPIFQLCEPYNKHESRRVTATMVADKIEQVAAEGWGG